jgi:hypothetical protein
MRREKLDHAKLLGAWHVDDVVTARQVVDALGDDAVAPLRLLNAYDELAQQGSPDALRALAEFADREEAWDALAKVKASKNSIAALAPMFTRLRPRRALGLQLARAILDEHVIAEPAHAGAIARGKSEDAAVIARVLAETGATLPADDSWVSPWADAPKPKPAAKPAATREIKFAEKVHWKKGEQQRLAANGADRRASTKDAAQAKKCLAEAKTDTVSMQHLKWLTDKAALETWRAIEPKQWYGRLETVQLLLARFGLAELDLVLAFLRARPESMAALANVESPRVAPLMARGFALLKKHHATGKAWLDQFPEAAAIGLLRADPDADKKQREANDKALAYLSKQHAKVVEGVLARAGVSTPPPANTKVDVAEKIHWKKGEREALASEGSDMRGEEDAERETECLKEAKTGQVMMLDLSWLSEVVALRTWKAIEQHKWFGQVDDVQQLLARLGLAVLDLVLAFLRA